MSPERVGRSSRASRAAAPLRRRPLALDDVVDFEHFGLARVDAKFCEDRHHAGTEGIELLFGVPDQADFEFVARTEAEFLVESVRRRDALLVQSTHHVVVLLCRQRRRGKADEQAHEDPLSRGQPATMTRYWGRRENRHTACSRVVVKSTGRAFRNDASAWRI
jgi:hypothetical protein